MATQLLRNTAIAEKETEEVVKIDSNVPDEVRKWLMTTFTKRKSRIAKRDGSRKGLKGVVTGISAALRMERMWGSKRDMMYPEGLEEEIKTVHQWPCDIHKINKISNGKSLRFVLYEIMQTSGLMAAFQIAVPTLFSWAEKLEDLYNKRRNPYHNALHAADVVQTLHYIIQQNSVVYWLEDLELLAAIFAAAIHDINHTGTTNNYHIRTKSDLAFLYNDRSVLENHHLSVGFGLLNESNSNILAAVTNDDQWFEFRSIVIEMVLATDMTFHYKHIAEMKEHIANPEKLDTIQVLSFVLHASDISHSIKPWEIHRKFVDLLFREFFEQGDREHKAGLEISPLCDRNTLHIPDSQITFNKYIIKPTFQTITNLFVVINNELSRINTLSNNRSTSSKRRSSLCVNEKATNGNRNRSLERSQTIDPNSALGFRLKRNCSIKDLPQKTKDFENEWRKCLDINLQNWLNESKQNKPA